MHYELVMIGAHDGTKTMPQIIEASRKGRVLLVEPVPFLYRRLQRAVAEAAGVELANVCISLVDGMVQFTAPKEASSSLGPGFDQIGSLNPDHATSHNAGMAQHVESILADSKTFVSLVRDYEITSIATLFTDMEGFDCELLPTFPFQKVVPKRIVFEFKHSDGTFRVGRKLGDLLIALDVLGYDIRVEDVENMVATLRPETPSAGTG